MKVCCIGVPTDGTGYASFFNDMCLALDTVGIDITIKDIKLAGQIVEPHPRIRELIDRPLDGIDIVIQCILPPAMVYHAGFKNIGLYFTETTHFRPSGWQYYLNLMDEVWVACEQNVEAALKSGVKVPIKVIPKPCDESIYSKEYQKLPIDISNRYAFYHIGDWSSRKNIINLIKCYFEVFSKKDNVVLVLKTYMDSKSAEESRQLIKQQIEDIKKNMRKYAVDLYPPIILICDYLDNEKVRRLHKTCDCFISLERGAAWNIPAFDAAAFGNWTIVNSFAGPSEFIGKENGVMLPYEMSSVWGMSQCPYVSLYSSWEEWGEPNLKMAKESMLFAYQNRPKSDPYRLLKEFSLESSGNKIKEILNETI